MSVVSEENKKTYVLQGWPSKDVPMEVLPGMGPRPVLPGLPFSDKVREWCQAGKKVRVTFEVVE